MPRLLARLCPPLLTPYASAADTGDDFAATLISFRYTYVTIYFITAFATLRYCRFRRLFA